MWQEERILGGEERRVGGGDDSGRCGESDRGASAPWGTDWGPCRVCRFYLHMLIRDLWWGRASCSACLAAVRLQRRAVRKMETER